MTSPVRTLQPQALLPEAARLLARTGVRRLFVVDAGRLIGVVTHRDLLREYTRDDEEIRAEVEREVFSRGLRVNPATARATVEHGVVTLVGRLQWQADVDIAGKLVKAIPGVVAVENRLDYLWQGGTSRTAHLTFGTARSPGLPCSERGDRCRRDGPPQRRAAGHPGGGEGHEHAQAS
ncbi:CBS domain-containing protein [Gandjariella thermophila]|uniref:BON domain-containing protein n=1 Tax=Gandjariella thermophila TaxID=1931992 RepID=A0A4D4JCQ4_9PSEU|nr:CBS domain-containing protein [Gandjariella thermophila]GDY33404.1 hypothetical protein GTS_50370 [Gandjariella thermophila]